MEEYPEWQKSEKEVVVMAIQTQWLTVCVVNGPPFFSLVLALFDKQEVEFTLNSETLNLGRLKTRITTVTNKEEGNYDLGGKIFQTDFWNLSHNPHTFKGSYNPETRHGLFAVKAVVKGELNSLPLLLREFAPGREQQIEGIKLAEKLEIPRRVGSRDTSYIKNFLKD